MKSLILGLLVTCFSFGALADSCGSSACTSDREKFSMAEQIWNSGELLTPQNVVGNWQLTQNFYKETTSEGGTSFMSLILPQSGSLINISPNGMTDVISNTPVLNLSFISRDKVKSSQAVVVEKNSICLDTPGNGFINHHTCRLARTGLVCRVEHSFTFQDNSALFQTRYEFYARK